MSAAARKTGGAAGARRPRSLSRPAALARDYPPGGLPATLAFKGRPAVMRLLRPEDGAHLIEFFESHTPETIHNRYGYSIVRMSPERAAELVGVDQSRDAALGLFEGGAANERLVAVGRCCRLDREDTAEMAFVVHEERRRLGMAGALLRALASLMRHRGVTHLVAQVQQDNEAMLGLFHKAGAAVSAIGGTDGLKVSLSLPGTPSPPRPGRP